MVGEGEEEKLLHCWWRGAVSRVLPKHSGSSTMLTTLGVCPKSAHPCLCRGREGETILMADG